MPVPSKGQHILMQQCTCLAAIRLYVLECCLPLSEYAWLGLQLVIQRMFPYWYTCAAVLIDTDRSELEASIPVIPCEAGAALIMYQVACISPQACHMVISWLAESSHHRFSLGSSCIAQAV
jgi:hypothetical protein